ncbi:ABC transporter ATP-binding protein [Alsobacter metallidurans]|uniref:ABC transporter ATP-binding protein n=1 Tax=Alsobacter metallidurans TaxID=340221 RepID=A0A917MFY8_9HYPH|nr:ABC transporter ATP-binding protein [Alsobacter metallidurans]GGH11844.1 ABC transporter ATP-binding protein [Alsobacter metallidurans]
MTPNTEPLVSIRDLAVDFTADAGLVHAVRGVSFDLYPGRTLAVVGESGSGKSVTANAMLRLLPKRGRIVNGSIMFRDPLGGGPVDIVKLDPDSEKMRQLRGARLAMIFQEPMTSLSPLHTVGDQVTEALRIHDGVSQEDAEARAMAVFERVGFRDPKGMLTTYPFELSGGMRQRAMIAMALICRPALLIADEPTTALDVTTQAQILALIKELQAETQMAVLLITHDLGVVANMADDVVVMYRGQVMERGEREDIFRRPQHPYLVALMRAVPHFDMKQDERLTPLREIKIDAAAAAAAAHCGRDPVPAGRTVLDVTGVSKTFTLRSGGLFGTPQRIAALSNVNLTLRAGETLGLVGESGSGKTTLSKVIMRAMAPDCGTVCFDDGTGARDVFKLKGSDLKDYRRAVQFVFQDPFSSLDPRMTVYDILAEPLRIHRIGSEDQRFQRVKDLLELVGLDQRSMRRYPHSFSGGQRQRIGLARALALNPAVILCDEPTSALDVSVQAQILNLLKDLQTAIGLSYLFVSHNLAVVDYMANDIAVMCRGVIVEQAPRETLFRSPKHPYTQALLAAVPSPDLDHLLDFSRLTGGGFSNPADWPEPFRLVPGETRPEMVEVEPDHRIALARPCDAVAQPEPLRAAS